MSKIFFHPSDSRPQGSPLGAIAARLSEAAQALRDLSDASPPPAQEASESLGETRCYYLSPATLKHERELLRKYQVDDFQGLLTEAHTLLAGLVKIMRSTHPETRLRGHVVASLGASLEQVVALLVRMRHVYAKVERMPS